VTIEDGSSNPPALSEYAWFCGNRYDSTYGNGSKPDGLKLPNGFGLYDMHGNLFEWTADWWGCSFPQASTDPYCSTAGSDRVLRGGGWSGTPNDVWASYRIGSTPAYSNGGVGFRLGLHP